MGRNVLHELSTNISLLTQPVSKIADDSAVITRMCYGPFMERITHAELVSLLSYEPDTGIFRWHKSRGRNHTSVNVKAGTVASNGYVYIKHGPKNYLAHRLAWLYVHKDWPSDQIDHINGDRTDNRLSNLRIATRKENLRNICRKKTNRCGYKGVYWHKQANKWRASITVDGKFISLGLYLRVEDASSAYQAAAIKYFGVFARKPSP